MRIALLTTDSLPARRCAQVLSERYDLGAIILRTERPPLPFETAHALDDEQDAYEAKAWFGGAPPNLEDLGPVTAVADMTAAAAADALTAATADVCVFMDAGEIGQPVVDVAGSRSAVLHAGDPQDFRGEDTHLWSVYHGEETNLRCVVQYAATEVNTGAVLVSMAADLPRDLPLCGLRKAVTDGCLTGGLKVLKFFDGGGMLSVNRLQRRGKVYTAMPSVLKDYCAERFARRAIGGQ